MQLSISVNISDIVEHKKNIFERLIARPCVFSKKNIKNTISEIKESGIKGLEIVLLKDTSKTDILKAKEFSNQYNLPILSLHQPVINFFNMSKKDIEKYFLFGHILDAKVIVIHVGAIGRLLADNDFILLVKFLQKKNKILMGIENMPVMPFNFFNKSTYKTKEFSQLLTQNGLSITFDTTHLSQVGENIVDFYKANNENIVNIHLSNYIRGTIGKQHTILTKGDLDINIFLKLLKSSSYANLLTLEINDSLQHIIESLRQIKITEYL